MRLRRNPRTVMDGHSVAAIRLLLFTTARGSNRHAVNDCSQGAPDWTSQARSHLARASPNLEGIPERPFELLDAL
jgi:hypothetical protein